MKRERLPACPPVEAELSTAAAPEKRNTITRLLEGGRGKEISHNALVIVVGQCAVRWD